MPIKPMWEEEGEGYASRVDLVDDLFPHEEIVESDENIIVVKMSDDVYYVREIMKQVHDEKVVYQSFNVNGSGLAHAITAIVKDNRRRIHIKNVIPADIYGTSPRSYVIVIERQGSFETDI